MNDRRPTSLRLAMFQAAAAALESCDYDEVTEVSEGVLSLLHHSSASQDVPALPSHHQLVSHTKTWDGRHVCRFSARWQDIIVCSFCKFN